MTTNQQSTLLVRLPDGYTTSILTPELEEGAVEVLNTCGRWETGAPSTSLEEMRVDWSEEGFNRETDTQLVLSPEGEVVAYGEFYDVSTQHVRMFSYARVHPDHWNRGIGRYLVEWVKERARKNVPLAEEGARVVLHQGINSVNKAACELMESCGYSKVRQFYRMQIDFDQPPVEPVVPEGIVIRSLVPGQDERDAFYASYDSFRDHWGNVEEPFDEYMKKWMHFIENDQKYDPSLFFIAFDGDEPAGISFCLPYIEEDKDMGWISTLGVRRAWRKRGLGLALLLHSFNELYKRGKPRAGLGVDATSLTGATRLYEKAGMRVSREYHTYEYELRPGKDMMRQ